MTASVFSSGRLGELVLALLLLAAALVLHLVARRHRPDDWEAPIAQHRALVTLTGRDET